METPPFNYKGTGEEQMKKTEFLQSFKFNDLLSKIWIDGYDKHTGITQNPEIKDNLTEYINEEIDKIRQHDKIIIEDMGKHLIKLSSTINDSQDKLSLREKAAFESARIIEYTPTFIDMSEKIIYMYDDFEDFIGVKK